MFRVTKTLEISAAHRLDLPYESACNNLHGHNWKISVTCESEELNSCGMVVDFKAITNFIKSTFDHKYINNVLVGKNPTAENMAQYICENIAKCVKVTVQESEGNVACYER